MKVNFGHSLKQKDRLRILLNVYGGAITTAQAQEHGIHRQTLSLLMQEGLITRIGHGIYCDSAGVEDELMALQARRQRIVYSHTTALYLHELTDRDPSVFDVTVPVGYNSAVLRGEGVHVYTTKREWHELGVMKISTIFGNTVRAYDRERTICDIYRDRNNQDPAVLVDALKAYMRLPDADHHRLMEYATILRIDRVLRPYLEVLL